MTRASATHTFRGRTFRVIEGRTHGEYSLTCFATEEADFRERFWNPQPGQVVVDVGASYGAYTLTAAALGAKVIAFEPERVVCEDLQKNCDLNRFGVTIHCCGLWDREDKVDIATYAPHWPPGTTSGPFEMRTLDSFELPRVDILKVDVEGAEVQVLAGAQQTLERSNPTVIIEVHTFLNPDLLNDCMALLPGYHFETVQRDPCVMLIGRCT